MFGSATPWVIAFVIAIVLVLAFAKVANDKAAAKKLEATQSKLNAVALDLQLTDDVASRVATAPCLSSDRKWAYQVVASKRYAVNFETLRTELASADGQTVELELGLICRESGEDHAVLVVAGALILGQVANSQSAELYETVFAAAGAGIARCQGKVTFETASANSQVQLDLGFPFAIIEGA